MVSYFWSKEGQKAFDDIGLPYPTTVWDVMYKEKFQDKTKHSPEELNVTMIRNLRRVLVGEEQFIVHDLYELRVDNVGNEKHHFKSNCGMYQVPIPRYSMVEDADGYKEKKVVGTAGMRTGYSIPFTKENVEKFVKKGWIIFDDSKEISKRNTKRLEAAAREKAAVRDITTLGFTRFSVSSENDRIHYPVPTYKDFIEGTWDELRHFGRSNVSKDDWARLKAVNEVAAAAKEQGKHILDDINNALQKNRTEEAIYK